MITKAADVLGIDLNDDRLPSLSTGQVDRALNSATRLIQDFEPLLSEIGLSSEPDEGMVINAETFASMPEGFQVALAIEHQVTAASFEGGKTFTVPPTPRSPIDALTLFTSVVAEGKDEIFDFVAVCTVPRDQFATSIRNKQEGKVIDARRMELYQSDLSEMIECLYDSLVAVVVTIDRTTKSSGKVLAKLNFAKQG